MTVEGANIEDLEIEPEAIHPVTSTPFVDPAIVSYQRPAPNDASASLNDNHPVTPSDHLQNPLFISHSTALLPLDTKPKDDTTHRSPDQDDVASATLTKPFNDLTLNGESPTVINVEQASRRDDVSPELEEIKSVQTPVKPSGRRNRKGNQKGKMMDGRGKPATVPLQAWGQDPMTPATGQNYSGIKRPKGWRQTTLTDATLEFNLRPHHDSVRSSAQTSTLQTKKKSHHHGTKISEDQNGWATGEASDIQDMGDFDFQGNLSKFDKRGVFDKIRQEDTTADEERLVSFNRVVPARPGTAGGKNLHYTDNVLDSPKANGQWNSGDSEKDISETKISSSRSSRKNVPRNPPSRKGSSMLNSDQYPAVSGLVPDSLTKARYSSHDQVGSPTSMSNQFVSRYKAKTRSRPSLRLSPSNHICPCLTPLQMAELEQLAVSELGLTDDMIIENAARGMAGVAREIAKFEGAENRRAYNNDSPLVIILAGNNKSGARAVAAGRHLRNHAARVLICILGLDREEDLSDSVRRQLSIYRNCGGMTTKADGLSKSLKQLQAPAELIIDALLGMHVSFDDLRTDDQNAYFQLASWANSSDATVLAIDVPSGLDATTGRLFVPC